MCYFAISQIIILFVKDWLQPIPFHHLHPKSYLHCTKIIFILLETPTSILPTKSTLLILEVRITSFAVSALGSLFFYVRKFYVIFTALPCFSQRFIKAKKPFTLDFLNDEMHTEISQWLFETESVGFTHGYSCYINSISQIYVNTRLATLM